MSYLDIGNLLGHLVYWLCITLSSPCVIPTDIGNLLGHLIYWLCITLSNVKNIFVSMCDVKLFLTFASLGLVLL